MTRRPVVHAKEKRRSKRAAQPVAAGISRAAENAAGAPAPVKRIVETAAINEVPNPVVAEPASSQGFLAHGIDEAHQPDASEPIAAELQPRAAISPPAVPDGYMRDARGRLVPSALVKPEQLLEDALVRAVHDKAAKLSEALRVFREATFGDVEALLAILAEKYGVELGGDRGNLTLDTFDGDLILQVSIGDQLDLGPELQVAKQLIDACIHRWSKGASIELQAIVNDAFDVDKKGKLNVGRILALRRMSIDDEDWKKAMDAIGNATRIVRSKRYLRLYSKAGDKAKTQVPLDLASV